MAETVDWQDLLREHGDAVRASIRVSLPAVVKGYDAERQVAECQIVVREPVGDEDGAFTTEELPIIPDVPLLWPGGGGFSAHFPLAPGDHVLLVFSDLATGVWRSTGKPSEPGDLRRHHLSYCFAIPIARSDAQAVPDVESDSDAGNATVIAPSGKTLSVRKSGASSDFVALSSKVDANFQALADMFSSWTPVANDGGAALKGLSGSLSFDATASATLKSD